MTKKVKLRELLSARHAIARLEKEKAPAKFSYALAKNKGKMQHDIDGLIAAEKEKNDLNQARIKYCEEHAERDGNGKPIRIIDKATGNEIFKGIDETKPEFIEIVDKLKKAIEEFNKFVENETTIDLHQVAFEDIPSEISPEDMEALSIMIADPK